MAPGCNEKLPLEFLWWIWTYSTRRRPAILQRLQQLRADQVAVALHSDAEADRFLDAQTR